MTQKIYGIDPNKKLTPLMIRDVIIECFYQAHSVDAGLAQDDEEVNKSYCREIVKKTFENANADFDKPSKQDILGVLNNLAEFAKSFRDPEIIKKHYEQIMQLVNKL